MAQAASETSPAPELQPGWVRTARQVQRVPLKNGVGLAGGKAVVEQSAHERSTPEGHWFTIDVENRIVIVRLRERVTLDSLLATAHRLYADERCNPEFDTIVEIQTTDLSLSFKDMHTYAERIGENPKMLRGKLVLVASTAVAYGIGRMYQGTHDSFPGEVRFESTLEAAMLALRPANL